VRALALRHRLPKAMARLAPTFQPNDADLTYSQVFSGAGRPPAYRFQLLSGQVTP